MIVPVTTLDENTALVVIDLQAGIVGNALAHPVPEVIARSAELARAFRRHGLPVVLVRVTGTPPGRTDLNTGGGRVAPDPHAELMPELGRQAEDHVVTKRARSAFTDTGLREYLVEHGVTGVVVTGISTSGGVESTARDAHERGFNVTLPVDAMTDRTLQAHRHSIDNLFPKIAETGTTEDVLRLLDATR